VGEGEDMRWVKMCPACAKALDNLVNKGFMNFEENWFCCFNCGDEFRISIAIEIQMPVTVVL